ncbi:MAG: hypothetical protein KF857_07095 [Fimbriimonadaceae bacterium]|nr:hypothetical protein [Fimbriimonadaceae bacterium]
MSLVLAVGVVAYSLAAAKPAPPRVSQLPGPTSPLHKPEPADLLRPGGQALRPAQKHAVQDIDRRWQADKAALTEAMARIQPRQGRVDQVQATLQDYSELSRRYDATRSKAWESALAVLDPAQRAQVAR